MMPNQFDFHPVGQGIFYSGSLNGSNYNFVFDCGSESDKCLLDDEIELLYQSMIGLGKKQKPTIDFVVISHLHKDHYSGLPRLLNRFKVKEIYLPYLGELSSDAFTLYLYHDFFASRPRSDFLFREFSEYLGLLRELYYHPEVERNDTLPRVQLVGRGEPFDFFSSGSNFWEFNLFCKKVDSRKIDDINHKCAYILNKYGFARMQDFLMSKSYGPKLIQDTYKKVFGRGNELNKTSIVLLHHPVSNNCSVKCCYYQNDFPSKRPILCFFLPCIGSGIPNLMTLLTGDATFDKDMAGKITSLLDVGQLHVLQIPHHGSKSNWLSLKNNGLAGKAIYVVPFGYGNKYGHPNRDVIMDLLRKPLFCPVTQGFGFKYSIEI